MRLRDKKRRERERGNEREGNRARGLDLPHTHTHAHITGTHSLQTAPASWFEGIGDILLSKIELRTLQHTHTHTVGDHLGVLSVCVCVCENHSIKLR